jgi:ketol-acid reductoisomerase
MGCLEGILEAQYNVLRKYGHSPSEAFTRPWRTDPEPHRPRRAERHGLDVRHCSTTAQRGALTGRTVPDAVAPFLDDLYQSVLTGKETEIACG